MSLEASHKPKKDRKANATKPGALQMAHGNPQLTVCSSQSAIRLSPGYAVATSARKWAMSRHRLGIGIRITIPVHSSSLQFGCHLFLLAFFCIPQTICAGRAAESRPTFCHFRLLSCFLPSASS